MNFSEFPSSTKALWFEQIKKLSKGENVEDKLIYNPKANIAVPAYCGHEDIFDKSTISVEKSEPFEICVPINLKKRNSFSVLNESIDSVNFKYDGSLIPEELSNYKLHLEIDGSDILNISKLSKHKAGGTITIKSNGSLNDLKIENFSLLKSVNNGFKSLGIDLIVSESKDDSELLSHAMKQADRFIKEKLKTENKDTSDIFFRLPLGTDFYLNLAKIRALKQCWYNLLDNYNLHLRNPFMIVETPDLSLIENETEQNMIRATSMAFASIAGGANVFIPRGLKDIDKQPENFALRMGRNIQLLLKEESFTTLVSDPGKGSYFIENLTKNIAELAWNKFLSSPSE